MKKLVLYAGATTACLLILICSGCDGAGAGGDSGYQVRYELTGTITAEEIIYFDEDGDEVTDYSVTPPWDYDFTTSNESQGIKLGAYNFDPAYNATLEVEVFIDGDRVLHDEDSSGVAIGANTGTYKLGDLVD